MVKIFISLLFTFTLLGSSIGRQDDAQRNHLQNDISFQNTQNQEYLVQHRPVLDQNYHQNYVPVPIHQLLHRSMYTHQPQAALIIVKAYPVILTHAQASHVQGHQTPVNQEVVPRIPNIQMVHYNVAPAAVPVYPTQPAPQRPIIAAPAANNYVAAANPGLYFAPPSTSQAPQGDSYLNQLAQVVAQQYSKSPSNFKAPAIIAGLENFSPEQQKQIKDHLNSYISKHAESEKEVKDAVEHREIAPKSGVQDSARYSSKISRDQFTQQSEWIPAIQQSTVQP